MIEIRHKNNLYIDGSFVGEIGVQGREPNLELSIDNPDVGMQLARYRFSDLPQYIGGFFLHYQRYSELAPGMCIISVYVSLREPENSIEISLSIDFKVIEWKRLWSLADYVDEFRGVVEAENDPNLLYIDFENEEISTYEVRFKQILPHSGIDPEIEVCLRRLSDLHAAAERRLAVRLRKDSVIMYFDFPEEVRVPCEQYLLYFIEFLSDLGIKADAELQQEAGKLLFAVTPTTAIDALDRIQTALEIYLHLPSFKIDESFLIENDVAVQKLAANIHHLKGQLLLQQAIIQSKDATIDAQRLTIRPQQQLSSGEIIVQSLKEINAQSKYEDKEGLLGGTMAITKLKGKGFEINLPEIIRRLRRFLSNRQD
jgi:hypothetical protein